MKKLLIISTLILSIFSFAQDFSGSWKGELDVMGQKLPLVFNITKNDKGYSSTIDSPSQGATGIAVDKTEVANGEITLTQAMLNATYKGKIVDGKLTGTFTQNGFDIPLTLDKFEQKAAVLNRPQTPKPPFDYNSEEVTIKNPTEGNTLAGTLASPKNFKKTSPILVMITGSGAQNRNEELFGHQPFWVIADNLAKKGIATLRMDDRGVGGSAKGKEGPTSADFATDINAAVDYLVKQGYKNIGLIGHSEGGMIAPMVASENKNVKFMVLLAGPGEPIKELMLQQNEMIGKANAMSSEQLELIKTNNEKIYDFIINYKGNNLEKDTQDFLIKYFTDLGSAKDQAEKISETLTKQVANPWFAYFIKFNPDSYLSKIKIPVLALNGSLDTQVSAKENLAGIKNSLSKAGNKNFKTIEFPGLNHLFQTSTTGSPNEYNQIEETISPKVLDTISSWILGLK